MLPLFLFSLVSLVTVGSASELTSCHLREFDLCLASLIVFTNGEKSVPANDAEIDRQCGFLEESAECLQNFTNTCMTDVQAELMDPVVDGLYQLTDAYCTFNSSLRRKILKHSNCMKAQARNYKPCVTDAQTAFEWVNANAQNSTQRLDLSCCAYWRWDDCNTELIKKYCAEEEAYGADGLLQFNEDYRKRSSYRTLENYCGDFKPGKSPLCGRLPAPGTAYERPKSKKARSILTRVLKAYTSFLN